MLTVNIYKDNLYHNFFSQRVRPNDAGFYSCVAGNILGETISRWDLAGHGLDYVGKKVDRRSCWTYERNFILPSQPLFHHLFCNQFTLNFATHPPLTLNTLIFKLLSFSAYLEINSSPPSQVSPIAAYLLLGLALTQTHIANRSVRMLNSLIALRQRCRNGWKSVDQVFSTFQVPSSSLGRPRHHHGAHRRTHPSPPSSLHRGEMIQLHAEKNLKLALFIRSRLHVNISVHPLDSLKWPDRLLLWNEVL